jgi:hypothetical protein
MSTRVCSTLNTNPETGDNLFMADTLAHRALWHLRHGPGGPGSIGCWQEFYAQTILDL